MRTKLFGSAYVRAKLIAHRIPLYGESPDYATNSPSLAEALPLMSGGDYVIRKKCEKPKCEIPNSILLKYVLVDM